MSRVTVDNILVGEDCTITSPNNTTASLAAATAAIDNTNLRMEGIDHRNLVVPGSSFARIVQFPAGSSTSPASTPAITWTGMQQCPPVPGGTPEIAVGVSNAAFVVVRLSCEMWVKGSATTSSSSARETSGQIGIARARSSGNYQLIDETYRSWQLGNIPNTGKSEVNETRQSIHIIYVEHISAKDLGVTFRYTPWVGTAPGTVPQAVYLSNINLSATVFRGL